MKTLFVAASSALLLSSCAVMHSYSITDPAPVNTAGREVIAEEDAMSFLRLNAPVFSGNIQESLRKQCPEGRIVGSRTWLTMRDWVLVQHYVLNANALCVSAK